MHEITEEETTEFIKNDEPCNENDLVLVVDDSFNPEVLVGMDDQQTAGKCEDDNERSSPADIYEPLCGDENEISHLSDNSTSEKCANESKEDVDNVIQIPILFESGMEIENDLSVDSTQVASVAESSDVEQESNHLEYGPPWD